MDNLKFVPFTAEDNQAALVLEEKCPQGKSLVLTYCRPAFQARSEVYDNCKILCARMGTKLIGIVAGTQKNVLLRGEKIRAAYIYDLRVHPDYRQRGVAKRLTEALLEEMGQDMDCIYTLIAGENQRAFELACRSFEAQVVVPLTYVVLPVYKRIKELEPHQPATASEVHEIFLKQNSDLEFVPPFKEEKLSGHVSSITLNAPEKGGCSIWTNENLLAERVMRIPLYFKLMRTMTIPFRPFLKFPVIPRPMEIIPSWLLFDFYAVDKHCSRNLLAAVNNLALAQGRTFLYLLKEYNSQTLPLVKNVGLKAFTFPYFFLAKGRFIPAETERIYIDIRDL